MCKGQPARQCDFNACLLALSAPSTLIYVRDSGRIASEYAKVGRVIKSKVDFRDLVEGESKMGFVECQWA